MAPWEAALISRIKSSAEKCTATKKQLIRSRMHGLTLITLAHKLSQSTKSRDANITEMRGKIQSHSHFNMSVLCKSGMIAAGYIISTNGPRANVDWSISLHIMFPF